MENHKLNEVLNDTRHLFLEKMYREDIISKAQMQKMYQYSVVVHKPSFFGRIWKRVWKKEDHLYYRVVKFVDDEEDLYSLTKMWDDLE